MGTSSFSASLITVRALGSLGALCAIFSGFAGRATAKNSPANILVSSPDRNNQIVLRIADDPKQLLYSVIRGGKRVVESSPIDVRLASTGPLSAEASVEHVEERLIDQTSELPWGKTRRIRNHCREASVRLKRGGGLEWQLELRAYDDGVAFRYGFPRASDRRELVIEQENTEFRLAGDPTVLYMAVDQFQNSHEAPYERRPLSGLPVGKLLDKPLLALWPDGTAAAITEARLRHFAGMYLERPKNGAANVLRCRLSPLLDQPKSVVASKTPFWSPWRVVLLAEQAGKLIESNLLLCLNEPPEDDFGWVKPGKTTFHWWNGTVEHGPASTPEVNFAIHKKYIDFCARHKIAYHSVISVAGNRPWFVQRDPGFAAPHADTDILTPRPDIDLPRILDYANKKNVGIRCWVHWKPLSEHLEEAFVLYERWGIRGLMVDFMDRDDQEMVEWQERCLQSAARHKLHIQFHGSYKPTGEQRTYPNLFNREGVLNLEYLKWSDLCTPAHSVNVAYTRALAGPVDYHLGGFHAVRREKFQPRDLRPWVMGTRCNQLALYVVFENPMPMVADDPLAYEGEAGFDFIVDVPTTWDETRFVAGEPGEYIVVARRSHKTWYLAGITDWTGRTLDIPLKFLGRSQYEAKLYLDSATGGENPNELRIETRNVSAGETIKVAFASGGGMAAVIRPK